MDHYTAQLLAEERQAGFLREAAEARRVPRSATRPGHSWSVSVAALLARHKVDRARRARVGGPISPDPIATGPETAVRVAGHSL